MADKKLFRISLLGGFNKKEVETYVRTMEEELKRLNDAAQQPSGERKSSADDNEQEIERLKTELEGAQLKIRTLEKQLEQPADSQETENQTDCERDKEIIARVLKDAYRNAENIVKAANEKAEEIVKKSKLLAEERYKEGLSRLQSELQRRAIDFVTMRYRVSDYVEQIESMHRELTEVKNDMQKIADKIPVKVQNIIEELEEEELFEAEYKESDVISGADSGELEKKTAIKEEE